MVDFLSSVSVALPSGLEKLCLLRRDVILLGLSFPDHFGADPRGRANAGVGHARAHAQLSPLSWPSMSQVGKVVAHHLMLLRMPPFVSFVRCVLCIADVIDTLYAVKKKREDSCESTLSSDSDSDFRSEVCSHSDSLTPSPLPSLTPSLKSFLPRSGLF